MFIFIQTFEYLFMYKYGNCTNCENSNRTLIRIIENIIANQFSLSVESKDRLKKTTKQKKTHDTLLSSQKTHPTLRAT